MVSSFPWLPGLALLVLVACGGSPAARELRVTIQGPQDAMPVRGEAVVLEASIALGNVLQAPEGYAFQWYRDGVPIPGATKASLSFPAVSADNAGEYQVSVIPPAGDPAGLDPSKPPSGSPTPSPQAGPARSLVPTVAAGAFSSADFDMEPVDQEWFVTSEADAGPGSLREVMATASHFDGINGISFALPPSAAWVIRLKGDLPPVKSRIRMLGPSSQVLQVDGAGTCRPFAVDGGELTLDNFSVVNGLGKGGDAPGGGGGAAGMGGALYINQGDVILRRMTFEGNEALGGTSSPGGNGENGGGAGFGTDSPAAGGTGAAGGWLGGVGGPGYLDGTATTDAGGGAGLGDGAGGGAARGGLLTTPVASWADNLGGGTGAFGAGGGFSVGPLGGGGDCGTFGGGGGSSGGSTALGHFLPGAAGGAGGTFGGDGVPGNGVTGGKGGGGGGMGGAIFLRKGTLDLVDCTFVHNTARPGEGGQAGLGKGGAIFVYPFLETAPFDLAMLKAQTYQGNVAMDLAEDASYDNNDYYVAQTIMAIKIGSKLDLFYRKYRQARMLGVPWSPRVPE